MAQLVVDMFNRYYKDYRDQDESEDAAHIDGILGLFGRLGVRHHMPKVTVTTALWDISASPSLMRCCCLGFAGKHPEDTNSSNEFRRKETKFARRQQTTGK